MTETQGPLLGGAPRQASGEPPTQLIGLALAIATVSLGLVSPFLKFATAPVFVFATVRLWLAVGVSGATALVAGRRPSLSVLRRTAVPGVISACTVLFSVGALRHGSVTVLVMIVSLQPALLTVVGGRWLGERTTMAHLMWTALGVLGVVVTVTAGAEVRTDALGVLFCVLAMLSYSAYNVANRIVSSKTAVDPLDWMFGIALFGGLTMLPVAAVTSSVDEFSRFDARDLAAALTVVVCTNLGFSLMCWTYRFVTAARVSLIMLGQTAVAIFVSWPMHDEPVSVGQAIGCVIVLTAVVATLRHATPPTVVTAAAG